MKLLALIAWVLFSIVTTAEEPTELKCGRDEVADEVVEFMEGKESCAKTPKNPKTVSDFSGGDIFGDFDGEGAIVRGTGYKFLRDQPNSLNTGKICFYYGCRRLAVSKKGTKSGSSNKWKVCLSFNETSTPNKKYPKCPAAIKVDGEFRELIEKLGESGSCCYPQNEPVSP